jgi:hypothetical protein
MALNDIAEALDEEWRRRSRRDNPIGRWAERNQLLGNDLDELETRLANFRGDDGRAVLRALVELAQSGDYDAALVVTLSIITSLARRLRRRRRGTRIVDYDAFVGAVWVAVTGPYSTRMHHLREEIVRRAWQIVWRGTTPPQETCTRYDLEDLIGWGRARQRRPRIDESPETVAVTKVAITAAFDRLQRAGQLGDEARMLLEQIAADTPIPIGETRQARAAYRQRRLRTVTPLRTNSTLLTALTA